MNEAQKPKVLAFEACIISLMDPVLHGKGVLASYLPLGAVIDRETGKCSFLPVISDSYEH